ncbi:MAG: DUF2911 domain-containing protein [Cyclobacteriaceae bacterium]
MKKKIFLGIGAVIIVFVGWSLYGLFIAEPASPLATAEGSYEDLNMKVDYSRPYKKGRVIFGEESEGALQPFGEYWRLGANASTEITFNKDVNFGGKPVAAGSYRMYAVPGANAWEVSLNSELGTFGFFEPDSELDVAKVQAPAQNDQPEVEQLTISFASDSTGAKMNLAWDKTLVVVPITVK